MISGVDYYLAKHPLAALEREQHKEMRREKEPKKMNNLVYAISEINM